MGCSMAGHTFVVFCSECKEEYPHKGDHFLTQCIHCKKTECLYDLHVGSHLLEGKTVERVYDNFWMDLSSLIVFTDGTYIKITKPYSDSSIDFEEM